MTRRRGGKGKIPSGGLPRTVGRPGAVPRNTAMADALLKAMASANTRASAASKPRPAVIQANRPKPKQSGVQNRSACAESGGPARTCPAKAPAAMRRDASNNTSNVIGSRGTPKPLNAKIAVAPPAPRDNIQRLKAHLSGLADAYEARVRNEAELCTVGDRERRAVASLLARGRTDPMPSLDDAATDIVLGIDFGSTSTKIVARLPFFAGSPAAAMPVPPFARAEANPHLWLSRLWAGPRGRLGLLPNGSGTPLCALKTRLICAPTAEVEAQVAGYLALLVAYARGWASEHFAPIARSSNLRWSYNFGFPAESLDRTELAERYRRVVAAALTMSRARTAPTAGVAAATLTQVSASAREILETFAATIQPEVAAAVAAAARASRLPPGLFMMMDVGGVTVDCCAFKLIHAENGDSRMPIYQASVETLGVECETLCRTDPPLHKHLRDSVLTQMRTVICDTYQEYMRANPCWSEGLPVLLVGGGAHHALYLDLVGRIGPWLRHYLAGEGCPGIRLFERPSFDGLLHEGETDDVHRLCVAIGLSSPDYEIPEVMHKREIVPLSPPEPEDLSGRYIGPEMT